MSDQKYTELTAADQAALKVDGRSRATQNEWTEQVDPWLEKLRRRIDSTDAKALRAKIERGLSAVDREHPVWRSVLLFLGWQIKQEHMATRQPGIDDATMRTRLGRESALEDFQSMLIKKWGDARRKPAEPETPKG